MAIPKKHSRPIKVDDVNYRWCIGVVRNDGEPACAHITIQKEGSPGVLQCVALEKPCSWDASRKAAIYPADIERLIHFGLERGWEPEVNGGFRPGPIDLEEFKAI